MDACSDESWTGDMDEATVDHGRKAVRTIAATDETTADTMDACSDECWTGEMDEATIGCSDGRAVSWSDGRCDSCMIGYSDGIDDG